MKQRVHGRAPAPERARRVNAGAKHLASGATVAEAVRKLAAQFQISDRQARRYIEYAQANGRIPIPGPVQVFTVKLPVELVRRLREYAKARGRTLSLVVAQALAEFLGRSRKSTRQSGGREADRT